MVILLAEVAQLAEVDIQLVHVQPIMYGMRLVHLVSVIVVSNIRVVEQDMQEEAELLVEENTRVVPVLTYMLGMEVLVSIHIITNVQLVLAHQVLVGFHQLQFQKDVIVVQRVELVIKKDIHIIINVLLVHLLQIMA